MTEFKIVPSECKLKVYLCLIGIFLISSIGLTVGLLYQQGTYNDLLVWSKKMIPTSIHVLSSE